MIKNIRIDGLHTKQVKELEPYVNKKIASLDRFLSPKAKESVKVYVKLKESSRKNKQERFACEVIFKLPKGKVTVFERASSLTEAVDIAEDKLKVQLKKYKEKRGGPRLHRRLLRMLRER